MSDAVFAFHLGGGLYMDSNGDLRQSLPPGLPVYSPGSTWPGAAQGANVAKGVHDAIANLEKDEYVRTWLTNYGMYTKLLDIISVVGKIAGVVAPVLLAVSFAIDLAKIFGVLKDGPSSLEILVKQRFDDLDKEVVALGNFVQLKQLATGRENVEHFGNAVRDYVAQLQSTSPSVTQLDTDRAMLRATYDTAFVGIASLLDPQNWEVLFDRNEHTLAWPHIYHLYTQPSHAGAAPLPAYVPPAGAIRFDHRLMVPLATYAAHTYLASIRGISPEYRSSGDFRGDLRTLARNIEKLAAQMLDVTLARTIYRKEDFSWPRVELRGAEVIDFLGTTPDPLLAISPTCNRWPVGAMDLRHHNDAFFRPFLQELLKADMTGSPHATKCGQMDFRWIPKARLARVGFDQAGQVWTYRITNPDECVAAANAQSAEDYAAMVAASGYLELMQLSVLFRHEAAEPDRSQTVRFDDPTLYADPMPSVAAEVTSEDIFMTGTISSPANREPRKILAHVRGRTQPIKRARPCSYQIKLRTLSSIAGENQWLEPEYGQYWRAYYNDDATAPGFLRVETSTSDAALDEHLLVSGPTPREPVHVTGTAELRAHTFDWWVPVPAGSVHFGDRLEADLDALGWIGKYAQPKKPLPDGTKLLFSADKRLVQQAENPFLKHVPELSWQSGAQSWDGEHRLVEESVVRVDYTVDWRYDRLHITLENRPSDRNYIVFVVVEELLVGTGTVLHTALPVPVNGQLTYVPQKFFDDVQAATDSAEGVLKDFTNRYAEFVAIGPDDPVVGWIRPGDLLTRRGIDRALWSARHHQPELLRRVIAEHEETGAARATPADGTELADVRTLPTTRDAPRTRRVVRNADAPREGP